MNNMIKKLFLSLFIVLISFTPTYPEPDDSYTDKRHNMVKNQIEARGITDKATLDAMLTVPRHKLVPPAYRSHAYSDRPLPIGYGQTISQPYIVAFMTAKLNLDSESIVLEVGTGSGYQAAVLSRICKKVYTIEIIPELGNRAAEDLKELGYKNIETKIGDGYYGWEEHAPFDVIMVTAAASHIPPPLIEQLKPGGKMIIPVGGVFHVQRLMFITKKEDGSLVSENLMPVRFVPLTRDTD